ncbi:MAG TPA: methyltransferase domain-containing protein, partial [Modicisalibacter sp.]|nr:methyltransferase domain-containing protein [Modicisalibacter sp.]
PYYAVIFTSELTPQHAGYAEMAARMVELAAQQPGFLGVESARDESLGITVSYWRDEASIRAWKAEMEHREAQRLGRDRWYAGYRVRVARVERNYGFRLSDTACADTAEAGEKPLGELQRASWDTNAQAWAQAIREGHIASRQVTDPAMAAAVLEQAPRRVLDLGCGEGWLSRELTTHNIAVVGVDACEALIESAREQGGDFHALDYATLTRTQRVDLPTVLHSDFDIVVANFSLLDEDIEALLRRACEWLAPGGRLLIQTLHPWSALGNEKYLSGWRREDFQAFGDGFTASMPWYYRSLGDWLTLLASAGLSLERLEEPLQPETHRPLSMMMHCQSAD